MANSLRGMLAPTSPKPANAFDRRPANFALAVRKGDTLEVPMRVVQRNVVDDRKEIIDLTGIQWLAVVTESTTDTVRLILTVDATDALNGDLTVTANEAETDHLIPGTYRWFLQGYHENTGATLTYLSGAFEVQP